MLVYYNLRGTISTTGNGTAVANVETYGGPTDSQIMWQNYPASTSGVFGTPQAIEFVYGQPFDFGLELAAVTGTVDVRASNPMIPGTAYGSGSGTADFADTLILAGLIPTDLDGNEAIGAQFSSASGTIYSTSGVVPVPEPATYNLFLACFLVGVMAKRQAWRRARHPQLFEDRRN